MRSLSLIALAIVLAFVAVLAVLLTSRSPRGNSPPTATSPSQADYRITEVHLREEAGDGVRWELDAAHAEVFERSGKTLMRQVSIRVEQPGRRWTVTGDEGELLQSSKDVELRGNVVVVSSDGLRLETSVLRWDAERRRAWTQEPVTVVRDGLVVRGRGLDATVGDRAATIAGPVRAVFRRAGTAREGQR
jgi:LPS export ABC transporter protein LptC